MFSSRRDSFAFFISSRPGKKRCQTRIRFIHFSRLLSEMFLRCMRIMFSVYLLKISSAKVEFSICECRMIVSQTFLFTNLTQTASGARTVRSRRLNLPSRSLPGRMEYSRSSRTSRIFISINAKRMPIQCRGPAPKGR